MKQTKIVPYVPIPFRKPNKFVRKYDKPFIDGVGNKAIITYVDYTDKKKNLIEGYVMYIKWEN